MIRDMRISFDVTDCWQSTWCMKLVCVATVEVLTFDTSASAVFGRRLVVPTGSLAATVSPEVPTVSPEVPALSSEVPTLPEQSSNEKASESDDDAGMLTLSVQATSLLLALSTSDGVTAAVLHNMGNHAAM